uniref:Bm11568 n=1 Tax=Brugia malayi TaxID=6279 RepID=A0A1I9G9H4_BRUMA|nr:Bm11568 [Brugia malayi]
MAAAQALTGGWNLPKKYGDQAERPPKSVSRAPSGMPGASSGKPDFLWGTSGLGRGTESSLDWAVARGLQEEVRFGGGPPHRESGLLWLASAPGLGEEGGHLGLSASGCGL